MVINHNIPALFTHLSMRRADRSLGQAMQRLSTGLRINSAREDAAGLAIANMLNYQVGGLNRASENASHGIALIQTAEGALNEVHNMLQRMRELAVYAATDTLTNANRELIQEEIEQLTAEIQLIASRTEYNRMRILNGEADRITETTFRLTDGTPGAVTRSIVTPLFLSPAVQPGQLNYDIVQVGRHAHRSINPGILNNSIPMDAVVGGETVPLIPVGTSMLINGTRIVVREEGETDWNGFNSRLNRVMEQEGLHIPNNTYDGSPDGTGSGNVARRYIVSNLAGSRQSIRIDVDDEAHLPVMNLIFGNGMPLGTIIPAIPSAGTSLIPIGTGIPFTIPAGAVLPFDIPVDGISTGVPATIIDAGTELPFDIPAGTELNFDIPPMSIGDIRPGVPYDNIGGPLAITSPITSVSPPPIFGTDAVINIRGLLDVNGAPVAGSDALSFVADGNKVFIRGAQGEDIRLNIQVRPVTYGAGYDTMNFVFGDGYDAPWFSDLYATSPGNVTGDPTRYPIEMAMRLRNFGPIMLQIGPSHNNAMPVQIPRLNSETLGLIEFVGGERRMKLNFRNQQGATAAIGTMDTAINTVSTVRARLGAFQNRLESTVSSLDVAAENTEISRSRIQDADIARESTRLAQYNVMFQAAMAILTQANQRPQQLVSLLQ